jgi:hypothetical protein
MVIVKFSGMNDNSLSADPANEKKIQTLLSQYKAPKVYKARLFNVFGGCNFKTVSDIKIFNPNNIIYIDWDGVTKLPYTIPSINNPIISRKIFVKDYKCNDK